MVYYCNFKEKEVTGEDCKKENCRKSRWHDSTWFPKICAYLDKLPDNCPDCGYWIKDCRCEE